MEALIIIDVQNGIVNKDIYKKDEFIQNINKAIILNREKGNLIIFIQHNSITLKNGANDWKLFNGLSTSDKDIVIQKSHGDAFIDTDIKQLLKDNNIKDIIICGLVSQGCVYHTCKSGLENGFNVKLIKNGHTNWLKNAGQKIDEVNIELEKMGAILISSSDIAPKRLWEVLPA